MQKTLPMRNSSGKGISTRGSAAPFSNRTSVQAVVALLLYLLDNVVYNLERLVKLVDAGYDVVVPQPTCTLVLRDEYVRSSTEEEGAKRVAERTFEVGHYLTGLAREKVLKRDFKKGFGKVAFHVACHTRAQAVGNNSPRLLGILPDTEVSMVESCSGHDGAWGVSKQYFPLSLKVGRKLFDNLQQGGPDVIVSDCPLASRHIAIGTNRRPIHTAQALAIAYGLAE
jgi:glycerol-3-phosphate dehydrogenase subunit C